jgi:decaprenyl-phosphate phosphoribosyltransferase
VTKGMSPYIKIARPDHWTKNLLALPGSVLACTLTGLPPFSVWLDLIVGMAALCLAASANYVINEWLDAEYDRLHPEKKDRVCASQGLVTRTGVYLEYGLLIIASLSMGFWLGTPVGIVLAGLLMQGVIYNIPPLRLKDQTYLDVIAESVNNPLRLLLGWLLMTQEYLPPSSLIAGYWATGAFLMNVKRYSEYRSLGDPELAGRYRASFKGYTEKRLLTLSFFYGITASFFLGVFMIKDRIELLLGIPLVAVLFSWYFHMAHSPNSAAEHPEKLHKQKKFMAYFILVGLVLLFLLVVDIPALQYFLEYQYIAQPQ